MDSFCYYLGSMTFLELRSQKPLLLLLLGDFHVGSTCNATKRMKPEACLCMQISNHMQNLQGTGGFLGSYESILEFQYILWGVH